MPHTNAIPPSPAGWRFSWPHAALRPTVHPACPHTCALPIPGHLADSMPRHPARPTPASGLFPVAPCILPPRRILEATTTQRSHAVTPHRQQPPYSKTPPATPHHTSAHPPRPPHPTSGQPLFRIGQPRLPPLLYNTAPPPKQPPDTTRPIPPAHKAPSLPAHIKNRRGRHPFVSASAAIVLRNDGRNSPPIPLVMRSCS